MTKQGRELKDLVSVGPAMARDFEMLGIRSVTALAKQEPWKMYERLARQTGQRQDPCVLDTFCAAVAQARNPRLPAEQCQWWWWSRKRKEVKEARRFRTSRMWRKAKARGQRRSAEGAKVRREE